MMIYENKYLYIEQEPSQIPWLKIFTQEAYKELSHCPKALQNKLFQTLMLCEEALISFYKPEKINIASFGNYLPHLHFHIMARFKEDEFFPEAMWGKAKRAKIDLNLPSFTLFKEFLRQKLEKEL